MTILRTVCPTCDVVRVQAEAATLRRYDRGAALEVDFVCPSCAGRVVQQLNARMLPLLVSAGCAVDESVPASMPGEGEGAISEREIQDFVEALDRVDWADELAW